MLGKDNWLFYTDEESIEDYKGTNLYTQEELNLIRDNCLASREYLEKRGIEFVVLIPSNKEDIYSDNLPDYITKRGELTRAQQVVDCLRDAGIRVVYREKSFWNTAMNMICTGIMIRTGTAWEPISGRKPCWRNWESRCLRWRS